MSPKDKQIISMLRKNGRIALTSMSKQTQIPVSTISDRIRLLMDDSIIGHTTLLNFNKIGYPIRIQMLIKVDRGDKARLKEFLTKENKMNSVFLINNGYDFIAEAIFKESNEMEELIQKIESSFKILEIKPHFVIEDVKREAFML